MEVWKPTEIEDYDVSNRGRIRSWKGGRNKPPHIMTTPPNTCGYPYCTFNGVSMTVHRHVAKAFIPNPNGHAQVDHINRNRADNRVENLRWVSASENIRNQKMRANNSSGVSNVSYDIIHHRWVFGMRIDGEITVRCFKTMEEAIEFKNTFLAVKENS